MREVVRAVCEVVRAVCEEVRAVFEVVNQCSVSTAYFTFLTPLPIVYHYKLFSYFLNKSTVSSPFLSLEP